MLRKLAVFIISAGLTMSPLSVQALGFGGIKLKSSLNEKLNAEVGLLSATTNDIQSLTVKLASEEAFLRAGIDRTAFLNKLKFKIKQRANGDYYIHITSKESVREPFMNFLLDLNWKNGRMLREYTMLVDPPGRATRPVAEPAPVVAETTKPEAEVAEEEPAEEPAVTAPDTSAEATTEPAPEPVAEPAPVPEYDPQAEAKTDTEKPAAEEAPVETPAPAAEEPPVEMVEPEATAEAPVEDPAAKAEVAETDAPSSEKPFTDGDTVWPRIPLSAYSDDGATKEPVKSTTGELDYGITQKDDNLWNIAEKLRNGDESVSVYQVMMALLQSNPDAFVDNNVHRLKVGHVLRIDDPSVLNSMTRKEAAQAFIKQTKDWNTYRQQTAGKTSIQPIVADNSTTKSSPAPADGKGELTLAAPEGENTPGGGSEEKLSNDLATIKEQLRQAKADAGTMRTRNVALNEKLQSLEKELNRLQRSLSVKDDELAALQQQLASLNQKPAKPPVTAPEATAPAEVAKPEETQPEATAPAEVAKPEEAQPETTAPAEEAKPEATKPETTAPAEAAKPETTKPATPAPVVTPPASLDTNTGEESIMDTVMGIVASVIATATGIISGLNLGSDTLLFVLAPVVLVFLIIALIVFKRRSKGDKFQESILTGGSSTDTVEGMDAAGASEFTEESSFLSDFAMSGASAIEAEDSEVDPLTEADVFMAYGRYEAAEERLTEAVQKDPTRMELRAKLLELHHSTQNKASFEAAAEDFYAALNGATDNPLWAKVVTMGAEIAPENPLFSQGGGGAPAASAAPMEDMGMGMTDSQVMDIGLETGVFEAADLGGGAAEPAADMDFNLDLGMGDDSAAAEPAADMDFNLDLGMGDDSAAAEPAMDMDFNLDIGGDAAAEEPAADMDFNLDMGDMGSTEAAPADDGGLDFSLDIGGADDSGAADLDLSMDMETSEPAADDGGLDFSMDMGSADSGLDFDSGSDGSMDLNLDASDTADADFASGDEVGTKLDLAKAYIDMGDPEGARSILDEVMDEGSSTQKEEAQSLLGQIA